MHSQVKRASRLQLTHICTVVEELACRTEIRYRRSITSQPTTGWKSSGLDPSAGSASIRLMPPIDIVRMASLIIDSNAFRDDSNPRHELKLRILRLRFDESSKPSAAVRA